jgi:undecaprenyl-diphosphatase
MLDIRKIWTKLQRGDEVAWAPEWDRAALHWVVDRRNPALHLAMVPLSVITDWELLWYAVFGGLCLSRDEDRRRFGKRMLGAVIGTTFTLILPLMLLCRRQRPFVTYPEIRPLSYPIGISSFPSGHAKSVWLVATVVGGRWPRYRLPAAAIAATASYARVYCGLHYPTDVLAGAVMGIALGLAFLRLFHRGKTSDEPEGPIIEATASS